MHTHCFKLIAICLVTLLASGCGSGGGKQRAKVYKVTGKVTYLNAPLIGATVSFAPRGDGPAAIGRTNDQGEFQLTTYGGNDGAAEGDYAVLVALIVAPEDAVPAEAHGTDPSVNYSSSASHGGGSGKKTGSMLPTKYSDMNQTPLSAKVEPSGANNFTFEIK
jgi:hypothetical protein